MVMNESQSTGSNALNSVSICHSTIQGNAFQIILVGIALVRHFGFDKQAQPQCRMVQGRGQELHHLKHPQPCHLRDQLTFWLFFKGNTISMDHHRQLTVV